MNRLHSCTMVRSHLHAMYGLLLPLEPSNILLLHTRSKTWLHDTAVHYC
jgi:hypothetical protein